MGIHYHQEIRQVASNDKVFCGISWNSRGPILSHPVPKSRTITGKYLCQILKTKFLPKFVKKRPAMADGKIILHLNNAPPGTCDISQELPRRASTVLSVLADTRLLRRISGGK